MYRKVSTDLSFVDREKEVIDFWKKNDIFKKSMKNREGGENFTFFDGPPTANGKPHIGHVLTRAVKDLIPRYRTMKGYHVLRKAGWDTHGLPVELEVEKSLGISGKPEIEKYGIEDFIKKCKDSVFTYQSEWEEMSERVGFWADMDNPYVTYHNDYIESVWWALRQIWDKGLLYKGHKIMPYCPRCGTSLSSHEVAQGYKDVKENSVIVKFPIVGRNGEYLLAWTTTPWTLPSNVALCVNPSETYVKVQAEDGIYILAEALVKSIFGDQDVSILEKYIGTDLCGMEYEPLYTFIQPDKKAYYVIADNYVTMEDGTGIVHIAPAFGEDDSRVGKENELPFINHVNTQGKFIDCTGDWSGLFVKDTDKLIIRDLKERNQCFAVVPFEHSYPFCWRCDTPLLYYACDTWFIKMTAVRDQLLKNNDTVNWLPDNIKHGRFGNFLENIIDWGLSRSRYWGTPLPIWECSCGHRHVVGSIAELKEMGINCPEDIELHKPYVDQVKLRCPKCGGEMTRVSEVIDCWFDSGSMPFAQWHYPFENKEMFENNFPADFISEAVDQTRGWFYTLMAIATLLFDQAPYKNVIVLGHVQDDKGVKMSKHKGNVILPMDILNDQGSDAVRWYFYSNSAPWLPNRFSAKNVSESQRKFLGTLWNTYAFYVLYAEIDQFDPTKHQLDLNKISVLDRWILSKLNHVIDTVDRNLAAYKITEATRAITEFTDELSNWYVRRSRARFWASEMTDDKISAYMTLYTALVEFAKVCAPFIPFMTEQIYQNLVLSVDTSAPESIHLCDFPKVRDEFFAPEIERDMDAVRKIVMLGRACRNEANIKNRQPLQKLFVQSAVPVNAAYEHIILEELNIKEVEFTENAGSFISYHFKPQMRTLGPKYGKLMRPIFDAIAEMDGEKVMEQLNSGEPLILTVDGTEVSLEKDDILVETLQKDGFVSDSDGGFTVVLDTNLTDTLIEEGFVREFISKVQNMRKDSGFEVMDHIRIQFGTNAKIAQITAANAEEIQTQLLAESIEETSQLPDTAVEWNINGEKVSIAIQKI
ncbi:isoleucine--tRNA ligase [Ructibacterium gallinarum]|uniref:Isoleucine--tRNA ligase n=1 Tax=Ructibacterium gallinarum TaxID=2779355 RepID=A0A9D5M1E3_9FIRM|nr:isoleucine--tRNA ligase [Ructibacterium gallinarum]MBE5040356.1 isoleucine--tRNA ligase [Ructibacterium gallinarum]